MLSRSSLETGLKWLLYLSFLVPLVVVPSSFIFPFIVPKVLAFRILVTIVLGAYTLLLITNWEAYRPRLTPLTIAVLLFFLSFGISTFTGVDPYHSFWDNHERMLGLFTLLHYAAYFLVCTSLFKEWSDWQKALKFFLVAGSVVMGVALIQTVKPDFLLNQGSARVISTLGNAIYVGGYGLFLMFVAALLFIKERNLYWRIAQAAIALVSLLAMFLSGTRGSVLGLAAALAVIVIAYALVLKDQPRLRQAIVAGGVLLAIIGGLLIAFRTTAFVSNIPAIGRAVNTSWETIKDSPRYIAWEIALKAWQEKPVFGWGPNNYYFAFNKYYNPRSLNFGYGETWFDNAHNIIVNTMAVQGTFGILTYLGIFVTAWIMIVKRCREGSLDRHVAIIGAGFLVAHLVQNVTVFENITSYLYFMFWLAMISRLTMRPFTVQAPARPVSSTLIVVVGLTAFVLLFVFEIQPGRANMRTLTALRLLGSDPSLGISAAKEALRFSSPHIDDIQSDIARSAIGLLSTQGKNLPTSTYNELYTTTYDALYNTLRLHPLDIRLHFSLSQLLQDRAGQTGNIEFLKESEKLLEEALALSPDRQQIVFGLSVMKLQLGKTDEALNLLLDTEKKNPRIGETHWRIAYIYLFKQDYAKARQQLDILKNPDILTGPQDRAVILQLEEQYAKLAGPVTTTPSTNPTKK